MSLLRRVERLEDAFQPPPPPVSVSGSALQFVLDELCQSPDPWQVEALQAIERHSHVAIRSGHDVGKTALMAWTAIWYLLTHFPCIVPVVANTRQQLRDVTWAEIGRWTRRLRPELRARLDIGIERIALRDNPEMAFMVARAASKDNPEALQGFHSQNLLFLLEEASGIDDIVFEVARGALASRHAKVLMIGNPTRTGGYFHAAFHGSRDVWHCMHVPWAPRPWTSPAYPDEVAREYGERSNVYRVRVLGEFPISMDDAVIPLEWIEPAVDRDVALKPHRGITWGLDVGRGGDASCLVKRHGNHVLEPAILWKDADTMVIAGRVARQWRETPADRRPASINVDVIGIGAGVHDRLRELGLPSVGINVGETQSLDDPERFLRLRDELWFRAREWFQQRDCVIPHDALLIGELSAPSYRLTSSGKIKVESKDEMKERGLRSPNAADAFCLTFAGGEFHGLAARQSFALDAYDPTDQDQLHRRLDEHGLQAFAMVERDGWASWPGISGPE